MPSKRKKNKRRMSRVQAQRRILEDQHVKAAVEIAEVVLVESQVVVEVEVQADASVEPPTGEIAALQNVKEEVIPKTEPVTKEMKNVPQTLEPAEALFTDAPVVVVTPLKPVVEASVDPVTDTVAADFVITECAPIVKNTPAEEEVLAVPTDKLKALLESLSTLPSVPETNRVTADGVCHAKEEIEATVGIEVGKDAPDEKKALDVLPGDLFSPQPIISELQCHSQLVTGPAHMEIPAEVPQNGHLAATVTIEE
ncbi:hypothetical protein DPEC_G00123620 [Dallia pectoralis]|uniref:Uncharacterized protein n=1 Tax=Dallia pectoralis TaxID=75939 RepID=A0ACC2GR93_DALPE|nr:hypothetical protein DPEC_G00123620 [Dallia pectoralis]